MFAGICCFSKKRHFLRVEKNFFCNDLKVSKSCFWNVFWDGEIGGSIHGAPSSGIILFLVAGFVVSMGSRKEAHGPMNAKIE